MWNEFPVPVNVLVISVQNRKKKSYRIGKCKFLFHDWNCKNILQQHIEKLWNWMLWRWGLHYPQVICSCCFLGHSNCWTIPAQFKTFFVRAGRGEFEQFIRISSHASMVGNIPVLLEFTKPNAVFISSKASKERIECLDINDLRNVWWTVPWKILKALIKRQWYGQNVNAFNF